RIVTEAVIRGELMTMELSERDFCPECCGTLAIAGSGARQHLTCTSCYAVFRPLKESEGPA
ncbi:MAG TPA: hypothetical protein VK689_17275, partial [Armatimonadota bacterium]|nr:hypothetical protein [Armatimonadota bacterium]